MTRRVLRSTWPAYAGAKPIKAYTGAMLSARLIVACAACLVAGLVAARPAGPAGAWAAGTLLLVLSIPVHLVQVWRDYPAWYHVVYLASLVPLTYQPSRLMLGTLSRSSTVGPPKKNR